MKVNGVWKHPKDVGKESNIPCKTVYNFVLMNRRAIIVDGYECVTLGHGITNDPVATHSFFGTDEVIRCLYHKDPERQWLRALG